MSNAAPDIVAGTFVAAALSPVPSEGQRVPAIMSARLFMGAVKETVATATVHVVLAKFMAASKQLA